MTSPNTPAIKEIVGREHWDHVHRGRPRMRLPSPLIVATKNVYRLLDSRLSRGMKVCEIGFAPGKQLAGVAARYGVEVSGIDYSEPGVVTGRELFTALGMQADLRCESIFETSFPAETFDLVYSIGVIEHFTDPRPMVAAHYRLIRSGGRCVILIPAYRGLYRRRVACCCAIARTASPDHSVDTRSISGQRHRIAPPSLQRLHHYYQWLLN